MTLTTGLPARAMMERLAVGRRGDQARQMGLGFVHVDGAHRQNTKLGQKSLVHPGEHRNRAMEGSAGLFPASRKDAEPLPATIEAARRGAALG